MSGAGKYTTEHIRLYLEGRLSPTEMHALESAALDDPFLADALEGMEIYPSEKFENDSSDLRKRLSERIKEKRRVIYPQWWKAAAVLLVVATGVAVIVITSEKNEKALVQLTKTEEKKEVPARERTLPPADTSSAPALLTDSKASIAPKRKQAPAESVDVMSEVNAEKKPVEEEAKSYGFQAPVATTDSAGDEKLLGNAIRKDTDSGKVDKALEGRAAGVGVVRSKSFYKKEVSYPQNAEPIIGWENFEKYISENKRISPKNYPVAGHVYLSFLVDKKGRPRSIRVTKSVNPDLDFEAVRLLRDGPLWKVSGKPKARIEIVVKF
jgi:hypothetical protein